jgi:prepilin-type processing-associated H-X9-DG protein
MHTRAFTLVEMMVVVGAVALLLALLMPALASVNAGSRSTKCQANLRQMAIAAQNYAAIFDSYPIAIRYETGNGPPKQISWDWVMSGMQVLAPGALWLHTDHPNEVMQCPDYHGKSNHGEEFTGYNYNTSYIGDEYQYGQPPRKGVRPHACRRGDRCAMFADAGWKNQSNRYMRAPSREQEGPAFQWNAIYSGAQAFRHQHACNIAFVDAHIGSSDRKHPGKSATPELLTHMGYASNGFLSEDDSAYDPR